MSINLFGPGSTGYAAYVGPVQAGLAAPAAQAQAAQAQAAMQTQVAMTAQAQAPAIILSGSVGGQSAASPMSAIKDTGRSERAPAAETVRPRGSVLNIRA
jgi:glutamate synthase domain-containing protein 2